MTGIHTSSESAQDANLARNIGFNVVKPDLHLERIRKKYGFQSSHDLCYAIQDKLIDHLHAFKLGTVDLMVFLYCLDHSTSQLRDDTSLRPEAVAPVQSVI